MRDRRSRGTDQDSSSLRHEQSNLSLAVYSQGAMRSPVLFMLSPHFESISEVHAGQHALPARLRSNVIPQQPRDFVDVFVPRPERQIRLRRKWSPVSTAVRSSDRSHFSRERPERVMIGVAVGFGEGIRRLRQRLPGDQRPLETTKSTPSGSRTMAMIGSKVFGDQLGRGLFITCYSRTALRCQAATSSLAQAA